MIELADALADDVDQHLLVWNVLEGFFYKMACHKWWIRSFERMGRKAAERLRKMEGRQACS